MATLEAPQGRHFYGHGTYAASGSLLFTTENDYDAGQGVIGVWDATNGYRRVGEFSSGGVGPHDIQRLPGTNTLIIANGGIETHPASGRAKLNVPSMEPCLSYIGGDGAVIRTVKMPRKWSRNSIRHISVSADGLVAMGMQWQGDLHRNIPLVATHRLGHDLSLFDASRVLSQDMSGYIGSIAIARNGKTVTATSPQGGLVATFDGQSGELTHRVPIKDVSGVASGAQGHMLTSGLGLVVTPSQNPIVHEDLSWDNHLVSIF